MFNEQDDHRCRKLVGKAADDGFRHLRNRSIFESYNPSARFIHGRIGRTSRHRACDLEFVLLRRTVMPIDQPTDHRVQQDDKCRPQRREKEEELGSAGHSPGTEVAHGPDRIQHHQCGQTHGRVQFGSSEMFQNIDHDFVRGCSRVESCNPHQGWDLADGDVERRARHEGGNGGQRDEVYNPAHTDQPDEDDDGTANNCQRGGHHMRWDRRIGVPDFQDHVADDQRHHGHRLGPVSIAPRTDRMPYSRQS